MKKINLLLTALIVTQSTHLVKSSAAATAMREESSASTRANQELRKLLRKNVTLDEDTMQRLIDMGLNINSRADHLLLAVYNHNLANFNLLLQFGAIITPEVWREIIALNNFDMIRACIDHGFDINQRFTLLDDDLESRNETLLFRAIQLEDQRLFDYLLDHNADVNATLSFGGTTPLYVAIQAQNIYMVERLLERGANPNAQALMGSALLVFALDTSYREPKKNPAIVALLCRHGANPGVGYRHYENLLGLAIKMDSIEMVKSLLTASDDLIIPLIGKEINKILEIPEEMRSPYQQEVFGLLSERIGGSYI